MTMTVSRALAFVVAAACATPPRAVPPQVAPPRGPVVIVDAEQEGAAVRLRWPEGLAAPAGTFTLIDAAGALGTVRVVGPASVDCDDCHVTLIDVAWVEHARACGAHCVAVGPGASPRARIVQLAEPDRDGATWQPTVRIDLDGDARWDVEQVVRCGGTTPSGCSDQVCNRRCSATRAHGEAEPAVGTTACFRFVPDVDDCTPSPAGA